MVGDSDHFLDLCRLFFSFSFFFVSPTLDCTILKIVAKKKILFKNASLFKIFPLLFYFSAFPFCFYTIYFLCLCLIQAQNLAGCSPDRNISASPNKFPMACGVYGDSFIYKFPQFAKILFVYALRSYSLTSADNEFI